MSVAIGTWNLENLCRPVPPGGPPSNRCAARDKAAYQAKLAGLAAVVDHLPPVRVEDDGTMTNRHSTDDERLRARYAAYALYRRAAEAVTMRFVADQLLRGDGRTHEVIVMGDLNDESKAATTQIL
ncbi:hypothetical protein [Streptomyces nojiriensis]|uniref:hypothetical protein n=1 Tax=Streptomyces nojiriensis TaxID=66374 RepID=UPI002E17DF9D